MNKEQIVYRHIGRADPEVISTLRRMGTATISHFIPAAKVITGLRQIVPGSVLAGPAVTVRNPAGHNLTLHKALEVARPGDVLVVEVEGQADTALWGGLMTVSARARGVAGMVLTGAVRDTPEILRLAWPVWATGTDPRGPAKDLFGAINVPVMCHGVAVEPGDTVVADADGIAVVPLSMAAEVARQAAERVEREARLQALLEQGELNYHIGGYEQIVQRLGIQEVDGHWQA